MKDCGDIIRIFVVALCVIAIALSISYHIAYALSMDKEAKAYKDKYELEMAHTNTLINTIKEKDAQIILLQEYIDEEIK